MTDAFEKKVADIFPLLGRRIVTEVPYNDPMEYFNSIETGAEGDILLLGGDSVSGNGRFSIAAVKPLFTISAEKGETLLKYGGETFTFRTSPEEVIDILHRHLPKEESSIPCFDGGLVFLLPYELNRRFEKLPARKNRAGEAPLWCGMYATVRIFDSLLSKAHDVSFTGEYPVSKDNNSAEQEQQYFISPFECDESKADYIRKIKDIQSRIAEGDAYQVNLSRRLTALFEGSPLSLFRDLAIINPSSFGAYINGGDFHFISMSPELFFRTEGNHITTKPIKGTSPRSEDPDIDAQNKNILKLSEKDKAENVMIVDLMRNDLSRICSPGSVKVSSLFNCESLPTVHHLVSTVEGELKNEISFPRIIRALFPGGSVTGAPKIKSMEIIQELETTPRGFYCGALTCCGINGNITASILIRTLTIANGKAEYRTGGGITAYSDPEQEFAETGYKAKVLLELQKKGDTQKCLEPTR
ncbi:MAG: aminodeoxychorismate synthase component I [Nitrospinota bacterium]|nr:aminodeoxychorismate synthase component I [Nitrospinota bacterium]